MQSPEPRTIFLDRLRRLHRRTLLRVAGFGLARVAGVGGAMVLWTLWMLAAADRPGPYLTWGLLISLAVALAALTWNHLLGRLWRLRRPQHLVRALEKRGFFANALVAAEEAIRRPERWESDSAVTRELRTRLLKRASGALLNLNPADAVPYRRRGQTWLAVAFSGLLLLGMGLGTPDILQRGWERLWDPSRLWAPPPTGGIFAERGPGFVVAGGTLEVAALDATLDSGLAICEVKIGRGLWQPVPSRNEPLALDRPTGNAPFRRWVATLQDIREDFQWRFRRGEMVSAARSVNLRHYPLITELAGTVHPPGYTRLPSRDMAHFPTWLEVPAGSRLVLSGNTNHPAAEVVLVPGEGEPLPLQRDGRAFTGELVLDASLSFRLDVRDSFGLKNRAPLQYEIVALPDDDPIVHLVRVGDDGLLPVGGAIDLELDAADDYGLANLDLELRVLDGDDPVAFGDAGPAFTARRLWEDGGLVPSEAGTPLRWQTPWGRADLEPSYLESPDSEDQPLELGLAVGTVFAGLDLMPGDVLELRAVARDNRRGGPPQRGISAVLRLSLPSAADVLAAQADSSQQRRGELEEMRHRGRKLGQDLDRLTRELLKNPVPDWARQQEMEAAIERQKKMQQELGRVARELQQDLDRLASGQMTSEQLLEKADEVSELLQQDPGASLAELLRKMEEGERRLSPQELAEAMREVARDQKEMARKLDAALSMLQAMDREQEMEGIASLLEKMIRKQQELADLSRQLAEARQEQAGESESAEGSENEGSESENSEGEAGENEGETGENQDGENQESSSEGESSEGENQEGEQESSESGQETDPGELPDPEELARRQEALAEELDQLREKLEEALAELQEQNAEKQDPGSQEMQQALEQALEQMDQQQSGESMDEASEQLAQMSPEMAAQLQQQALRDLGSLYHVILKTQSAMQAAMDNHQATSLRKLAADMLSLSARQEKISGSIPARIREVRSLDLARSQHRVQKAAIGVRGQLNELTAENPTRIIRLLEDLDEIIETMGQGLNSLQENRAHTARTAASAGLSQANRMVIGLLTEAQMTSSQSGGSGGQQQKSISEQLKEMAKDQAELNALTEQMRQMLANRGLSQQVRSQMKRLGEGQGELAGRMQELEEQTRGTPEGERVLGDLGALGDLMETIGEEVGQGLVSEETLIRQERILSRMLDARNSVRQRDYSKRRESRTAGRLHDPESGLEGRDGTGGDSDPFELRYQPLEKAPQEYRRLVRKYFRALQEMRRQDSLQREVP